MDPEVVEEAVEVTEAAEPGGTGPGGTGPGGVGPGGSDQRVILGNTGQNVLGLAIGALATFAAQVIMTQRLGDRAYGVVTLTTQFAFIAAAATRFGMDVANVRLVAILVGRAKPPAAAPWCGAPARSPRRSRCRSRCSPTSSPRGSPTRSSAATTPRCPPSTQRP